MLSSNIANFIIMVAFKLEAQYAEPVSLTFHSALRKPDTEPSIDDSYQVSVHLAMQFQRKRFFRNRPIRNKNCMWRPCLLTEKHEMSNLYRGPSIDASYQVTVHLAKERRFLRNQPIKNKNCLWWPCLLMNRDEMSNLHRGPSKDASYQILVHLGKRIQKRRFLELDQLETRIACGGHVC
jgi:hypothetical protein